MYIIPEDFFKNKKYINLLTPNSKLLYLLLLQLETNAIENGWIDTNGNKFVSVGNEFLAEKLGISEATVIKSKSELISLRLIDEIQPGRSNFNFIYILGL